MKFLFSKQLIALLFVNASVFGVRANTDGVKSSHGKTTAKEFRFSSFRSPDIDSVDKALVPKHFLGDDVAVLYYIFQNTYVDKRTDYSSATLVPEIQKPAIYDSIVKINKLLKKAVKNNEYTKDQAAEIMKDCLKKSYAAYFIDTNELEAQLSEMDGLEQYIALYNNISFE